jgi:hypothetical protein
VRPSVKMFFLEFMKDTDHLSCLVVKVPGYRSRGPGSIPSAGRFSEE